MFPELREIIDQQWNNIPRRFPSVSLDEYIIMPNHLHGILIVGATLVVARKTIRAGSSPAPTIGSIIGAFKSLCAGKWLRFIKTSNADLPAKIWQRNYFEHVIRNDSELNEIRDYIINNPVEPEAERQFDNL
jgi:REP element-mobilizing transposase RayT